MARDAFPYADRAADIRRLSAPLPGLGCVHRSGWVRTKVGLLTERAGKPDAARLFLFAVGGVIAFVLLEAVCWLPLDPQQSPPTRPFSSPGAFNVALVAAAFGMAALVVHLVRSSLAWFLAPMGTTAV